MYLNKLMFAGSKDHFGLTVTLDVFKFCIWIFKFYYYSWLTVTLDVFKLFEFIQECELFGINSNIRCI